jgi:hypothetical protein
VGLVVLGLSAAMPAAVSAQAGVSKVVTYITTYTGVYSFVEYQKAVDYAGRTFVTTQNQSYVWQEETKDVIIPHKNGTITENRYTTVDAGGDYDGVFPESTPGTAHCEYGSHPSHEFKSKVLGNPEGLRPVHGNPLIPYMWTLPEQAGQLGVTSTCASGGEILAHTPSNNGTVNVVLANTRPFEEAFDGNDSIRFKSMPALHPIDVTLNGRMDLPNGGYDQARTHIQGGVKFERWGDPRNNNKIGSLLLDDLLNALGAKTAPDGSPAADGQDDTILVPGMAPGTVTTEVTGTVSWSHGKRARASAAKPTTLYTGRATLKGNNAVVLRLVPTAAGRSALAVAHPSIPVRLRVTFNPRGAGSNTTKSRSGTLGARVG